MTGSLDIKTMIPWIFADLDTLIDSYSDAKEAEEADLDTLIDSYSDAKEAEEDEQWHRKSRG